MNFTPSSSGITFIGNQPLTQQQMLNVLADLDVPLVAARIWNSEVTKNTPDATTLPESINPYDGLEIKGQGIFSSCFAAAMIGVAERQQYQATAGVVRYAIWPFYMLAQMQTQGLYGSDGGTVPPHGIKAATSIGFLDEKIARQHLPDALVAKWGGDVYPRNYRYKTQRQFEEASRTGYREACAAYESVLKREDVRESMHANRMLSIIPNESSSDVVASERSQTATTLECHSWGSSMDSDPLYLRQFPGPPPAPGAQHGHHATYIIGLTQRGELLKANSWRMAELIRKSRELEAELKRQGKPSGQQSIDLSGEQEWGDDGVKIWDSQAHANMMRDQFSYSYACSNMSVKAKPKVRIADTSNRKRFT